MEVKDSDVVDSDVVDSDVVDTEVFELTSELFESLVVGLSCVDVGVSKALHTLREIECFSEH
jgi:hypothetical protein